ncbi:MAG TPA: flavodoxin-dependent (E)-4-hydroxy-3-methylbut-2-enyl-diphosphate synthase [Firmicutes bacterium]|nr:flavodoxin-dependent (E)-4-hydroxy-3-methylbut-2-enyl-diphosphate synthase [Bacillota bacterium]
MEIKRRKSRRVNVGTVQIGGDAPVSVQSMTKTDTRDVKATIEQIARLEEIGCDIVRVAVPDVEAAEALRLIRKATRVPLVADIHFDYRLALRALEAGVDKLRINPGNIGPRSGVEEIAREAASRGVPIRVGVNAGSLDRRLLDKYGGRTADALAESAIESAKILEDAGFGDIVISLKASDPATTIDAYRLVAKACEYPLHVGLTEAGSPRSGTVKSAIVIGLLLAEGIGDTIRVSLTGDPVEEVRVGREILMTLGMRGREVEIISCPTCGRCKVDLRKVVREVEDKIPGILPNLRFPLKVAIMGCEVNGPGEARDADIGLACGKGGGILFIKGEMVRRLNEDEFVDALVGEIKKMGGSSG